MKIRILPLAMAAVICFSFCGSKKDVLVRSDKDGLLEARIEDGKASIVFNFDRWDKMDGLYAEAKDNPAAHIAEGPRPIPFLAGRVKDACLGKIVFEPFMADEFIGPTILLLLEDGRVERAGVDPLRSMPLSLGVVPFLKNIVSLSYEKNSEGIGEWTIFAKDAQGLRYNMKTVLSLTDMISGDGHRCELSKELYASLKFNENGTVVFEKYNTQGSLALYTGKYTIYLAEDGAEGKKAGTLALDLSLQKSAGKDAPEIHGVYFVWQSEGILNLMPAEGDSLHTENNTPMKSYQFFWMGSSGSLDVFGKDTDAIVMLLFLRVPEAYENVMIHGMTPLVTDETSPLGDERGRNIWLGTNHDGHFVRETLYAITSNSVVYTYDPSGDGWNIVGE